MQSFCAYGFYCALVGERLRSTGKSYMSRVSDMKGYHNSKTPETIRDLWRTPRQVFEYYNRRFSFTVDMAASKENKLCEWYLSEKYDALNKANISEIVNYLRGEEVKPVFWCNPPYRNITPWVRQCIDTMSEHKVPVVMLIPADTSVKWFKLAFDNCTECHFISGRLAFINEETGKPVSGNNKGSVVFIFDPNSPFKSQVCLIDRNEMMKALD